MFDMKPCPFCAGESQELSLGTADREGTPCAINCTDCGAVGPMVYVDTGATPLIMLTTAAQEWDKREQHS